MKILIDDWRNAWRKLSVQFTVVIATYGLLPVEYQQAVMTVITEALAAAGIPHERVPALLAAVWLVLRLLNQGQPEAPAEQEPKQ